MHRILTTLDLAGNEVVNIILENVEELPSPGQIGRLVYLTSDNRVYFHNGLEWTTFGEVIQPASEDDIGGIKVGENLSISPEGVLSTSCVAQYFDTTQFPSVGNDGKVYISLSEETVHVWDSTNERYLVVNGSIDFVQPEISVTTLESGQPATATVEMEGTRSNKKIIFNFGIPKGDTPNLQFILEENGDLYVEY